MLRDIQLWKNSRSSVRAQKANDTLFTAKPIKKQLAQ